MRRSAVTAIALTVVAANVAAAQIFAVEPRAGATRSGWGLDVAIQVVQPVHEFADNIDNAFGVGASIRHHFSWFRPLGLRGDFAMLNYGNERQRVPLSSSVNRVNVEMNTSNNILVVGGGPELAVMRGPVRPYVHGFVGYSYFFTESSAGDDDGGGTFARSTNFSDGGLATGGGAGMRLPLRARSTEISIDGGARYTRNGVRTYLRRGDVIDLPDGSLDFTPRTTQADFWTYYLGVSLDFGRRRR
jgi:hypothetical protein